MSKRGRSAQLVSGSWPEQHAGPLEALPWWLLLCAAVSRARNGRGKKKVVPDVASFFQCHFHGATVRWGRIGGTCKMPVYRFGGASRVPRRRRRSHTTGCRLAAPHKVRQARLGYRDFSTLRVSMFELPKRLHLHLPLTSLMAVLGCSRTHAGRPKSTTERRLVCKTRCRPPGVTVPCSESGLPR
ncbi:hypothetical protein IWX50DRAFT_322185 [Phyllosticta citricarpa]|uniref:Secreted protein n=1 Tax=Phyllosticta citricarpa TaxID=55181 RepID=A0ABR1MG43_9PEZI